jgi:DNA-directed RNA polymerase specialized sigma24 family protein
MSDRDAWEHPLYLFAAVLLGDGERARAVVIETLEAVIAKPPAGLDAERLAMRLFQDVRTRALKLLPAADSPKIAPGDLPPNAESVVAAVPPDRILAALHALPEPGRSALALLLLDELESDHVAKMLGLDRAEFAVALSRARLALHGALAPAEVAS